MKQNPAFFRNDLWRLNKQIFDLETLRKSKILEYYYLSKILNSFVFKVYRMVIEQFGIKTKVKKN